MGSLSSGLLLNERSKFARVIGAWVACALAVADGLRANNPIVAGQGLTDPYAVVYGDRVYLYATHDYSAANRWFVMKNWWIWSSRDLVTWQESGVLQPETTFLGRPFDDCWATCAICRNGKYYWYFSAGPYEIGVVVADSPTGPWRDPLGRPLIPRGLTPTEQRDPNVLIADDGHAYLVFGTYHYFIARLHDSMLALAEAPRAVVIDHPFGPYGSGKTDDKPSLHKRQGLYYLSWSSFYAEATNIYGPYAFRGSVIQPDRVSPKFRRPNLVHDRHGNFFEFHGQWYYACNDKSQPGRSDFFRDSIITYVHFKDNGDMAPVRIDEIGVGQYDARQPRIEAEDYFSAARAEIRECPAGGFEVRGLGPGSALCYPKVKNLEANSPMTFSVACGLPAGAVIEVHAGEPRGALLGTCRVPATGGWDRFEPLSCTLRNAAGTQDICLVFRGDGRECCRLDWFTFAMPARR
jgi:hypothetical protein